MFVSEPMTREPVTIAPDETLLAAAKKMRVEGVRRLPVVENGALVGIISEYDLQPHLNQLNWVSVREVMTPDPVVVEPSTTVDRAARLLSDHQVGALPVVHCGRLVGIIEAHDLLMREPRPLWKWDPAAKKAAND